MKKDLFKQIEIPEGVEVVIGETEIKVKGPEGETSRGFNAGRVRITKNGNEILVGQKNATKTEKKMMNTFESHIKNMIKGVQKKYEYKLKICHGHFPFTLKQEGNKIKIKNFLGEKVERELSIPNGAEVEIKKDTIEIKSVSKELAGQASANFETATKIRGRDRRIFQDGIYIIEKDGKKI